MTETYHALNEAEAIEFARQIPDLFLSNAQLSCNEIGDGNLNLVFHIKDEANQQSVIIKQALPYAKVVGESWPLTLDRARIESETLMIQHSLCPNLVPRVFLYDPTLALTVMEDLSDHIIMRQGLISGYKYPEFASHIGLFLAKTLFFTSDYGMNQQEKKLRVRQFINPELCKITEDLIFDAPYTNADTNNFDPAITDQVQAIWEDSKLHLEVALLREKFLTSAQALLHGDLHTGSIFITETSTKVIDPEFAYYGPMGFDVGQVIANLLLNFAGQEGWSENGQQKQGYRNYLLNTVQDVWNYFEQNFITLWNEHLVDRISTAQGFKEDFMRRLLQDTIGFAGCEMIRRVVGLAHVADVDKIEDSLAKERAERMALTIGRALIMHNRKAKSIEEVLDITKQAEEK